MTYRSHAIARGRFLVALAVVVGLAVPACGGACHCPGGWGAVVTLPGAQSQMLTVSSNDPACYGSDASNGRAGVSRDGAGTCQFVVKLENGDSYTFSVEFRQTVAGNDCKCAVVTAVDASVPELVVEASPRTGLCLIRKGLKACDPPA
jgi:hypothetical protein